MSFGRFRSTGVVWGPPLLVGAIVFGCGGAATRAVTSTTQASATSTTASEDVMVTEQSFRSLRAMTPIRGFFVDNLLGDLPATRRGGELARRWHVPARDVAPAGSRRRRW